MVQRSPGLTSAPLLCDGLDGDPARTAELRALLIDAASVTRLADTFNALGDATRVRILDALSKSELCVSDLAALVGLSESAVSHQLRLLRGMRVVRPRRSGRMVFYSLDDQHILSLFQQGLRHVEEASRGTVAPPPPRSARAARARRAGPRPRLRSARR